MARGPHKRTLLFRLLKDHENTILIVLCVPVKHLKAMAPELKLFNCIEIPISHNDQPCFPVPCYQAGCKLSASPVAEINPNIITHQYRHSDEMLSVIRSRLLQQPLFNLRPVTHSRRLLAAPPRKSTPQVTLIRILFGHVLQCVMPPNSRYSTGGSNSMRMLWVANLKCDAVPNLNLNCYLKWTTSNYFLIWTPHSKNGRSSAYKLRYK